ncbi:hypothetical protein ABMA28_010678 [Loxostege sticticalis]|uniref:Histone-lysine N-methyltransferase SETMAR n=1 Tax=Loxostege sticticalis TaxID=481309 RepID=A0ABD0S917_LOXSC
MKEELAAKQPRLVNRSRPLLLHDNARPHTAQQTTTKLDELQLECLRHPPYFTELAPTDYHFFWNFDVLIEKKLFLIRKKNQLRCGSPNRLQRVY